MNPLSMESIFIILSGAILMAGVLYWLWSHIQLTQKKVQLLENAVFELRSMLSARGSDPPVGVEPMMVAAAPSAPAAPIATAAKPPSEYKDLDDDDWKEPEGADVKEVPLVSTPLDPPALVTAEVIGSSAAEAAAAVEHLADLIPGGRAGADGPRELDLGDIGASQGDDERFRDFFKQSGGTGAAPVVTRTPESLESMPVKELRRLAEQRGIAGAADMRKKEILAALRQQITSVPAQAAGPVTVEREGADDDSAAGAPETVDAEILE
jgi:hypothetical protein